MKVISIDTSGKFCSISISLSNRVEDSINSSLPLSHSSELAVNIKKIIKKHKILIQDLDFIAINIGPGSFTGLRIGISFAKGLCLSNNIPLVPINSFEIIDHKVNCLKDLFYYGIYSHKDYIYSKKYDKNEDNKPRLISLKEDLESPLYINGLENIAGEYNNNIINIDFNALDLINIGINRFKNEKICDLNSISPIYIDYNNGL